MAMVNRSCARVLPNITALSIVQGRVVMGSWGRVVQTTRRFFLGIGAAKAGCLHIRNLRIFALSRCRVHVQKSTNAALDKHRTGSTPAIATNYHFCLEGGNGSLSPARPLATPKEKGSCANRCSKHSPLSAPVHCC